MRAADKTKARGATGDRGIGSGEISKIFPRDLRAFETRKIF